MSINDPDTYPVNLKKTVRDFIDPFVKMFQVEFVFDSYPRKAYIESLIAKEAGKFKTSTNIYRDSSVNFFPDRTEQIITLRADDDDVEEANFLCFTETDSSQTIFRPCNLNQIRQSKPTVDVYHTFKLDNSAYTFDPISGVYPVAGLDLEVNSFFDTVSSATYALTPQDKEIRIKFAQSNETGIVDLLATIKLYWFEDEDRTIPSALEPIIINRTPFGFRFYIVATGMTKNHILILDSGTASVRGIYTSEYLRRQNHDNLEVYYWGTGELETDLFMGYVTDIEISDRGMPIQALEEVSAYVLDHPLEDLETSSSSLSSTSSVNSSSSSLSSSSSSLLTKSTSSSVMLKSSSSSTSTVITKSTSSSDSSSTSSSVVTKSSSSSSSTIVVKSSSSSSSVSTSSSIVTKSSSSSTSSVVTKSTSSSVSSSSCSSSSSTSLSSLSSSPSSSSESSLSTPSSLSTEQMFTSSTSFSSLSSTLWQLTSSSMSSSSSSTIIQTSSVSNSSYSSSTPSSIVDTKLQLYYDFAEIEDEFGNVLDKTDNSNNGLVGSPSQSLGPPSWAEQYGVNLEGGYHFQGNVSAADYIVCQNLTNISDIPRGTVSFWINLESSGNYLSVPFCISNGYITDKTELRISIDRSRTPILFEASLKADDITYWKFQFEKTGLTTNEWIFVTLVHTGLSIKSYLQGEYATPTFIIQEDKSLWISDLFDVSLENPADRIVIGGVPRHYSPFIESGFSGYVDEIKIWSMSLPGSYILEEYERIIG